MWVWFLVIIGLFPVERFLGTVRRLSIDMVGDINF
jgi:hypothetical protein